MKVFLWLGFSISNGW